MAAKRRVEAHFLPDLVDEDSLRGGLVVVIDVLRACTTFIHALAAGCTAIYPTQSATQARQLARELPGDVILAGERQGLMIEGFDRGNSPSEFVTENCNDRNIVCTTTNGTRAIYRSRLADRVLLGAFVNYSAICEEIRRSNLPVHLVCAGWEGRIALDDVLFAGAVVDCIVGRDAIELNDAARIAWDAYEHHGDVLICALELSEAGQRLLALGFDADLKDAAHVDRFGLVPELRPDPWRIEAASLNLECNHYRGQSGLV